MIHILLIVAAILVADLLLGLLVASTLHRWPEPTDAAELEAVSAYRGASARTLASPLPDDPHLAL